MKFVIASILALVSVSASAVTTCESVVVPLALQKAQEIGRADLTKKMFIDVSADYTQIAVTLANNDFSSQARFVMHMAPEYTAKRQCAVADVEAPPTQLSCTAQNKNGTYLKVTMTGNGTMNASILLEPVGPSATLSSLVIETKADVKKGGVIEFRDRVTGELVITGQLSADTERLENAQFLGTSVKLNGRTHKIAAGSLGTCASNVGTIAP